MFGWLKRWRASGSAKTAGVSVPAPPTKSIAEWWQSVSGPELAQGDYLPGCLVPEFHPDFGQASAEQEILVSKADLIVVTQSCDLENAKTGFAALCRAFRLEQFEETNPKFRQKKMWEEVRKGRVEGLHLLAGPTNPNNNRDALVVDFRQIFSLPIGYLARHAQNLGNRARLQSPYVEHFSQAFARFFMRVGLPSAIPPYK